MSKLHDLIQELCLEGVEFRRLGDICELSRGKIYSKSYITENIGNYPVYSSQTANNGELGRISTYDYDGEYLTWTTDGAYAGTIFHRTGKFSITNVCGLITVKSSDILIRFLYYWLSIKAKEHVYQGMGNPKLMSNQMLPIEIPIPPLEVQNEIVRILDNFTSHAAELQAELQARKEQYEYYRNKLLTFDENNEGIKWMKLGEICKIMNGKDYKHLSNGNIPVYGSGGIMTYVDNFVYDKPSVLLPRKGSIGNVFYVDKPFWTVDTIYWTKIDTDLIIPKFFYYYIQTENLEKKNTAIGAVPSLTQKILNKIEIPLPSLSEQQRIVSILDKFEALVNDLTAGLPAEIAAVQEQYEYYRNKLLTFNRIN